MIEFLGSGFMCGFSVGFGAASVVWTIVAKLEHADAMRMLSRHGDWLRKRLDDLESQP